MAILEKWKQNCEVSKMKEELEKFDWVFEWSKKGEQTELRLFSQTEEEAFKIANEFGYSEPRFWEIWKTGSYWKISVEEFI